MRTPIIKSPMVTLAKHKNIKARLLELKAELINDELPVPMDAWAKKVNVEGIDDVLNLLECSIEFFETNKG